MQNQNTSDIIELYLKQLLADQPNIEIRRAEVAQQFNCVPSQINYVINTRFTPERGYIIKSNAGVVAISGSKRCGCGRTRVWWN